VIRTAGKSLFLGDAPDGMDGVPLLVSLTNKDARPFGERQILFSQKGILKPVHYFSCGDSIGSQLIVSMFRDLHRAGTNELTDALKGVTHLLENTASGDLRQSQGEPELRRW
jgi:hypothetical protein